MSVDWSLIKDEYEVMHRSVEELADANNVSVSMIAHAIKEGCWEVVDVDTSNVQDDSDRLAIMQSRNDMQLVPKFIRLQSKMLDKCNILLDDVAGINDAHNLKIVSEVIEKHRPAILGVAKDGKGVDNQMVVRIMTSAGTADQPSVSAVEITGSAGASNGIGEMKLVN